MATLKVGIAGYGVVGKRRQTCIDRHPDLCLEAVCDRRFDSDGEMAGGVRYYTDYHKLLREDLDALVVCLTNDIEIGRAHV